MSSQQEFGDLFLKEFILTLIEKSAPIDVGWAHPEFKAAKKAEAGRSITEEFVLSPYPAMEAKLPELPQLPVQELPPLPKLGEKTEEKPEEVGFNEKINSLIKDSAVQSIECQGPGKNLIINKLGAIEPVNVSLSEEEISSVVKKFIEKTGVSAQEGIIKASLGNLKIVALASDYLGTRFIIQKQ